jgi:hypothetical protein
MYFFETGCESLTGKILYSDSYAEKSYEEPIEIMPLLNTCAAVPFLGIIVGVARIALAILHIIGHLLATAIFSDRGHLFHAAKGGAELLRGIIEALPIVGRLFVWYHDTRIRTCFAFSSRTISYSCFIVKIYNPENPDPIDLLLQNNVKLT